MSIHFGIEKVEVPNQGDSVVTPELVMPGAEAWDRYAELCLQHTDDTVMCAALARLCLEQLDVQTP